MRAFPTVGAHRGVEYIETFLLADSTAEWVLSFSLWICPFSRYLWVIDEILNFFK